MSNDLISRSALMSRIESGRRQWGEDYDIEQILGDIEDTPTAYDVDKVVEQLEDRSTLSRPVGWPKSYEIITVDDAVEIVKGGGVNDD